MQHEPRPSTPFQTLGNAGSGYLAGQLLIAMPGMTDPRFQRTLLYMCAHTPQGAMGLVVNKLLDSLTVSELFKHLDVQSEVDLHQTRVHFGGPVESARGFVLHSCDYMESGTLVVGHDFALTATLDVLRALGRGTGPRRMLLALGYANWAPGQLDTEIQNNVWLNAPADDGIVFDAEIDTKWERAIAQLGIDLSMLSIDAGHA